MNELIVNYIINNINGGKKYHPNNNTSIIGIIIEVLDSKDIGIESDDEKWVNAHKVYFQCYIDDENVHCIPCRFVYEYPSRFLNALTRRELDRMKTYPTDYRAFTAEIKNGYINIKFDSSDDHNIYKMFDNNIDTIKNKLYLINTIINLDTNTIPTSRNTQDSIKDNSIFERIIQYMKKYLTD